MPLLKVALKSLKDSTTGENIFPKSEMINNLQFAPNN